MIFAALAAGCSILPAPPGRADVYDFGPGLTAPPAAPAGRERTPRRAPIALTNITNTSSPGGSSALFYRLAYANAQQLRPYAQARWSQPPAQLLQQALRDRLSQGRVVLLGEDGAAQRVEGGWPTVLRVELEEFSQVFSAPQASVGLVRLRASVARAASSGSGGDRLLGQRVFVVQRPAATQDAAGGARALAEASAEAADELAQWLEQAGW
jgi:cholesterol transport system auxiliary component